MLKIKSLRTGAKLLDKPIQRIELLGDGEMVNWPQDGDALTIQSPAGKADGAAIVFKITLKRLAS